MSQIQKFDAQIESEDRYSLALASYFKSVEETIFSPKNPQQAEYSMPGNDGTMCVAMQQVSGNNF